MNTVERRHDLDWLRLIAIIILLFYHTGMLFSPWDWHIKNPETSVGFTYWMVWLHYWRMPLLLFISGAGTFLALRKRTPGQFIVERVNRLIIPLIFGMFVIVPPQIYFEHIGEFSHYTEFYKTVFDFVPYPGGSLSWHHLWFIAYLFLYSLIGLPLLLFLKSSKSQAFKFSLTTLFSHPAGLLFVPSGIMLISQIILRPFFPEETHALIDDWAFFTFYFLFFLLGILCYSQTGIWNSIERNRRTLLLASMLIMIPFYIVYFHFRRIISLPWSQETIEIAFQVTGILGSWFWVITVIAWGQYLLNRPHAWLRHFNEGLYPFYILHQTVIVAAGFYICQLDWTIFTKFWTVAFVTLLCCLLIYFLIIRPFSVTRLLFGMKTHNKPATKTEPSLVEIKGDT